MGCRRETEVRSGLLSGWQTVYRGGREEKARREAGTCHGRHRGDASESSCSPRGSGRVGGSRPLVAFPWALAVSGADPHWHAWRSQSTPGPQTQSRSLRPTALHRTTGLTTDRQAEEPRDLAGLQCHYLSCFLGRVLLQNLGLAAGEERGLEVQAGGKQEKEH